MQRAARTLPRSPSAGMRLCGSPALARIGCREQREAREARHPLSRVGSGEATRTWLAPVRVPPSLGASRPMPRTADTIPRAVSNRVRSSASPALARIGCWELLEMNGGGWSRRRNGMTLAGLESNRIPHLPLRPRLARASRLLTETRPARPPCPETSAVSNAVRLRARVFKGVERRRLQTPNIRPGVPAVALPRGGRRRWPLPVRKHPARGCLASTLPARGCLASLCSQN